MFKRIISLLLVFVLVFALAFSLTSCGKEYGKAAVFILGKHANAYFDNASLQNCISDLDDYFTFKRDKKSGKYTLVPQIGVIVSDGEPKVQKMPTKGIVMKAPSNYALKKDSITTYKERFPGWINSLNAVAPEVDLIKAINQAKKYLDKYPDAEEKTIYIFDTGCPTAGFLNFTRIEDLQEKTADDIINDIDFDDYPDLSGINVKFYGLGNVNEPQKSFESQSVQDMLVELWERLLGDEDCMNADDVDEILFSTEATGTPLLASANGSGLPFVSVIPLVSPGEIAPERIKAQFVEDKATFVDPESAKIEIKTYGKEVWDRINTPGNTKNIYVVSSIAVPRTLIEQETSKLASDRTRAVVRVLVNDSELQIPRNRIIAIDAGTIDLSWRVYKHNDGRILKEADANDDETLGKIQEAHRVMVMFTDDNVEEVQELKDKGLLEGAHIVK